MPQHKDLKRLVRARMDETGENYTQALTALLSEATLDTLPGGWFVAGSHPGDYDAGLLPRACAYDGKRVIRLRFRIAGSPGGFGTVMQSIDAARYRGGSFARDGEPARGAPVSARSGRAPEPARC